MKYFAYILLANNEIYSWGVTLDDKSFPNDAVDPMPFAKNAYESLLSFCSNEDRSKSHLTFYNPSKVRLSMVRYRISSMEEFHSKVKSFKYINKFKGIKIEDSKCLK